MNKKRVLIFASLGVLILLMTGTFIFTTRQSADTPDRLLSLGEKYLTELNYEQALVQFLKVIEIDPMNPRGYTGAAEAYVGLGRMVDAIAILQQGLELTDDYGIRDLLNEIVINSDTETESKSVLNVQSETDVVTENEVDQMNLTGKAPFSFADLEEFGYPWGIDIYELRDKGLIYNEERRSIDEWLIWSKRLMDDNFNRGSAEGWMENPNIYIYHYNNLIGSIKISGEDRTIGPRGVCIGMPVKEVVDLFRCVNPEALEYAKNQDITSLPPLELDIFLPLYGTFIEDQNGMQYSDNHNGMAYDGCFKFYDDGRIVLSYRAVVYDSQHFPGDNFVDMTLYIEDGLVSGIDVEYHYE